MKVINKKSKQPYDVADIQCLGRSCLNLGSFQHRGAIGGGASRNTGACSLCCMTRAYYGCPDDMDDLFDQEAFELAKLEGWRQF